MATAKSRGPGLPGPESQTPDMGEQPTWNAGGLPVSGGETGCGVWLGMQIRGAITPARGRSELAGDRANARRGGLAGTCGLLVM